MTNVTDVKRMPEGILDEYLTRLKNENILLSEFLKDTMDLAKSRFAITQPTTSLRK